MSPLLELKNLGVTYATGSGEVAAVRGVDLVLEPGDTLGVAGESGSGKSTVAMSVLRLLPRSAKVSGEMASCWPTPGLLQSQTPPGKTACILAIWAPVSVAGR